MSHARGAVLGVFEFVVGDDRWSALGVVLALALTGLLADAGVAAWWVMPPAVVGLLALSVWRAAREAERRSALLSCENANIPVNGEEEGRRRAAARRGRR